MGVAIDAFGSCRFGSRFLVGTMSSEKVVYSLPDLSIVSRTKPVHDLGAQAVAFVGDKTALSVSGDRSLHFSDCQGGGISFSSILAYLILVLIIIAVTARFVSFDVPLHGGVQVDNA